MKKQTVTMTPDGGRWWRMQFTHWGILTILLLPIVFLLCFLLLNPLWFRDDLLIWFENKMNAFSVWRNKLLYRIYLGIDPELWHALKD
jgi:hypothetical protein